MRFQSTLPLRGATKHETGDSKTRYISIHAPLAGSDIGVCLVSGILMNFNPRSPCGERPGTSVSLIKPATFQSTLPLRGATPVVMRFIPFYLISIHAPLAGSDALIDRAVDVNIQFQSTLPLRGATLPPGNIATAIEFQSTLPLRGATHRTDSKRHQHKISIHAPLAGSDCRVFLTYSSIIISIHAPLAGSDRHAGE